MAAHTFLLVRTRVDDEARLAELTWHEDHFESTTSEGVARYAPEQALDALLRDIAAAPTDAPADIVVVGNQGDATTLCVTAIRRCGAWHDLVEAEPRPCDWWDVRTEVLAAIVTLVRMTSEPSQVRAA